MDASDTTGIACRSTPVRAPSAPSAATLAALFALAATASMLGVAFAGAARATPLEVYGRLPRYENVVLSPDGSRVAFVRTEAETRVVAVMKLASGEMLARLRASDQRLRGIGWADDDHLMISTSVTAVPRGFWGPVRELNQLQVYDIKAGKSFMVPESNKFSDAVLANFILGQPIVRRLKDHTVLFVRGLQMGGFVRGTHVGPETELALLRVDLESHSPQVVRPGKPGNLMWLVDSEGEVAAEQTYDQGTGRWSIFILRNGQRQQAASGEEMVDVPSILGLGPTPGTALLQAIEDGNTVWHLLSLTDGSIGPPMAERKVMEAPIEDRQTHRMIGGVHRTDTEEYVFFDPTVQQSWQAVMRAFPNERVRFESASADFRKVIVRVEGDRDGYCFELVDLNSHRAEPLGDVYEGVKQAYEVRPITYVAADGLQIPAYLTLPRGKPPKNLPLIVLPHGGPAVRDTTDFNWWSQALADQGYAVLQPNYRGSAISRAFISKGLGEWGRKMQTDLSDGVRYLASEGIADPKRVCIVGGSYGGYAALAGASLDSGVYRCAVAVAGISDIRRMLDWINGRNWTPYNLAQRYWDRFMGISGPNDPTAEAISPIRHLDAITVPVLLIHGKDDTVVPFEQSQLMYDALRGAHKDVELVTLKGQDHWLSRGETRLQMLQSSVAFLRAHNPPD